MLTARQLGPEFYALTFSPSALLKSFHLVFK